jgi:hypothetical protein
MVLRLSLIAQPAHLFSSSLVESRADDNSSIDSATNPTRCKCDPATRWDADLVGSRPHSGESRRTLQLAVHRAIAEVSTRRTRQFVAVTVIAA